MEDSPTFQRPNPDPLLERQCPGCRKPIDPTDRFCRHCGLKRDKPVPLPQQRWVVLSMLFLVVGPFALPLLWRSPCFSRKEKILIGIANVLFSVGLLVGTVWLAALGYHWAMDQIDITMNLPFDSLDGSAAKALVTRFWD